MIYIIELIIKRYVIVIYQSTDKNIHCRAANYCRTAAILSFCIRELGSLLK